MRNLASF